MKKESFKRKHSRQRDAILRVICATDCHPSAAWVYERVKPEIPDISLGTVYRNIGVLKNDGAVVAVGVVDGEERIDGCTEPHPHFFCANCRQVFDLPVSTFSPLVLSSEPGNFQFDFNKTAFYGLCPSCRTT